RRTLRAPALRPAPAGRTFSGPLGQLDRDRTWVPGDRARDAGRQPAPGRTRAIGPGARRPRHPRRRRPASDRLKSGPAAPGEELLAVEARGHLDDGRAEGGP